MRRYAAGTSGTPDSGAHGREQRRIDGSGRARTGASARGTRAGLEVVLGAGIGAPDVPFGAPRPVTMTDVSGATFGGEARAGAAPPTADVPGDQSR